jgi:hypothetical protein
MESDSDRHERIRAQYYNGFDWGGLSHDERYRFIFMIEAAAFCKAYEVEDMRRACHKELCDQALNKVPNEDRDNFGGTYQSICDLPDRKIYFDVKKPKTENNKKKRNTRIMPHIPEIKQLVESKKTGNTQMRVHKPPYNLQVPRYIFEPSVGVSDRLGSPVVTHANENQKGVSKRRSIKKKN